MSEKTKQCSACRREGIGPLPVSQFGSSSQTSDGLARHCKSHAAEFVKKSRKKHGRTDDPKPRRRDLSSISQLFRSWPAPNMSLEA
jgi:hypothetical protein